MGSPLKQHEELEALDREIDALDQRLIEEDREAHGIVVADLQDERAYETLEAKAFVTRQIIARKLREHRKLARELLQRRCPVHPPDALFVGCPDCCRAWGYVVRGAA